jgi:hypothetical protein
LMPVWPFFRISRMLRDELDKQARRSLTMITPDGARLMLLCLT